MLNKQITFGGTTVPAYLASAPSRPKPTRKMTVTPIAGTNREVVEMEDAWESVDQPYTLVVGNGTVGCVESEAIAIARALYQTGIKTLTDGYDTTHFRLAYFQGPFDVENRFTQLGKADVTFRCRPELFLNSGATAVTVASGGKITNPTVYNSKPLIHVEGSGNGTLVVAGVTIQLTDMVDYLNIDCDKMDTYRLPTENRNSLMTGNYPVLKTGDNTITYSGGITKVDITPRWYEI